jgi:hypothetical protein
VNLKAARPASLSLSISLPADLSRSTQTAGQERAGNLKAGGQGPGGPVNLKAAWRASVMPSVMVIGASRYQP